MSEASAAQASNGPHPLQFKWTLWHDTPAGKGKDYAANLRQIASFDTVEDFWALFNNLKEPSQLIPANNTYNLFKSGIEPKWEDPANTMGGEWRCTVPTSRSDNMDEFWVNTVLTVIGEGFGPDESDDIAGIVVNIKRSILRIAIWTKSSLDESLQMRIGNRWKETANIMMRIEYLSFKEALNNKNRARPRYVLE